MGTCCTAPGTPPPPRPACGHADQQYAKSQERSAAQRQVRAAAGPGCARCCCRRTRVLLVQVAQVGLVLLDTHPPNVAHLRDSMRGCACMREVGGAGRCAGSGVRDGVSYAARRPPASLLRIAAAAAAAATLPPPRCRSAPAAPPAPSQPPIHHSTAQPSAHHVLVADGGLQHLCHLFVVAVRHHRPKVGVHQVDQLRGCRGDVEW